MHPMQHLSHPLHVRKQTPFSPHLRKSTSKVVTRNRRIKVATEDTEVISRSTSPDKDPTFFFLRSRPQFRPSLVARAVKTLRQTSGTA